MMSIGTYAERRGRLETYFDRTAMEAWAQLTSDEPVSRIRQTVRQGRDQMRAVFMDWLPRHMDDLSLLDAGCGTGALSIAAARRGADVLAVDVASNLVNLAQERAPLDPSPGSIDFRVGDMLDPDLGRFDHVAAMDSLIHYPTKDIVAVIGAIAQRTRRSIIFTFAPRTSMLSLMWAVGRLFPRADRAPAIEPVVEARLRRAIESDPRLKEWAINRTHRVASGFYTSQAMELVRR
jgi:magnesium-protoporphyrin O-methyltransferase